jgi:hypothetical protein
MRFLGLRQLGLAALIACMPASVLAQCAGFSDVPTSSGFCGNVVWMKNRGVTQGCTGTTYCPGDSVTRLAMAAFMNRVGNVLTPRVYSVEDSGGLILGGSNAAILCETPDIPGVDYHRTAQVDAKLSFGLVGAGSNMMAVFPVVVSRNGGPWQAPQLQLQGGGSQHGHAMLSSYPLTDGAAVTLRFALQVSTSSGGDPPNIDGWGCHLVARIRNAVE